MGEKKYCDGQRRSSIWLKRVTRTGAIRFFFLLRITKAIKYLLSAWFFQQIFNGRKKEKRKRTKEKKLTLFETSLIQFGLALHVSRCLLSKRKRRWDEPVSHLRRCRNTRRCQTLCYCGSRSILSIQKETHGDPNSGRQYGDLQPQWSSSWKAHPLTFAPSSELPLSLLLPFLFLDPFFPPIPQ